MGGNGSARGRASGKARILYLIHLILFMKRLYRSGKDRILGGVCGGIGEHLDLDPSLVRLLWVAITLISLGTGIIVYIAALIIIPESPEESDGMVAETP